MLFSLLPQYPSSNTGSSTPSTPESTRSTSSNSRGRKKDGPKARTYPQDPKYPDDAEHWHSKHKGKCPDCDRSNSLTKPKWHSEKKRLFIRCRHVACKYWRYTDYYDPPTSAPPVPASSTSTPAESIPTGVAAPCLANPCTKGNKRNRNAACASKMCREDCILSGTSDCSVHRKAKRDRLSGIMAGRPPPVLFNGPSLPSMPSIPPSSLPSAPPASLPSIPWSLPSSSSTVLSPLDAALPPSSPNPPNPRSLHDITTSTIRPSLDNPLPRPSASPLEEGPVFKQVRRYARELPLDWAAVIAAQQSAKANQMRYEADFRSEIKEGISITVAFWPAELEVTPFLFERVIHAGTEYSLSEDVDLCSAIDFDPKTAFVLTYLGGMWSHRSPWERHQVKSGSWLFFRVSGPGVRYEDALLRFDELLALSTDPAFGGASNFLSIPATAPQSPVGPRPRPRPKLRPLGLPKVDHRYNWITTRGAPFASSATAGTSEAATATPSQPTPSPSGDTPATTPATTPTTTPATTLSAANSSAPSGSGNAVPKRDWPDDYTIREIHKGFVAISNKGRARKGSGITLKHRFLEVFPDAEQWYAGRYYPVLRTWEFYVGGDRAEKDAFKAWLKTDALWTSVFAADIGSPPAKRRKLDFSGFDEFDF